MNTFRWILVAPSAIFGWFVAFFLGALSVEAMNTVGGLAFDALLILFSGVSALLVVSASVLVAPAGKDTVAIVALVNGTAVATAFLVESDYELWRAFAAAILVGAATCHFFVRRYRRRSYFR